MRAIDISDMTFGELKPQKVEINNKKRGWLCECSCGRSRWFATYQLTNNKVTNCGHYSHKLLIQEGDIFGELCVIRNYKENKRYIAVCQCSCGNVKNISHRNIQRLGYQDCGCKKERSFNRGLPEGEAVFNSLMSSYKSGAKIRNLEFKITDVDCMKLFKDKCVFCGREPFNIYRKKKIKGSYVYNGIDRINSKEGYFIDNVQSCCKDCNFLKKNKTDFEFVNQIKIIYENLFKIKEI